MKNSIKHVVFRVLALLLTAVMLITVASCQGTEDPTGESKPETDTKLPDATDGEATTTPNAADSTETKPSAGTPDDAVIINEDYVIIYEKGNSDARNAAEKVRDEIFESCGIFLKAFRDPGGELKETEILIGSTSREQSLSLEGLGCGWAVGTEGRRCMINAAIGQSFDAAVAYFISCLEVGEGTVTFKASDSKREAVEDPFASANITLRVATFNIKNGSGVDHDMTSLAELIIPLELDIVGLQEVDVGTNRADGLDTLKLLAEAAGYEYYEFAPAINFDGGQYGTAIMSKYPITEYETVELTTPEQYEQRACGHAVVDVNGYFIHFYNTHLSYEDTAVRKNQFNQLNGIIQGERGFILTGDFNAGPSERKLIEGATLVNSGQYATFPEGNEKIDDIIVYKGWKIVNSGMVSVGSASDHNLLWAELHFEK